MDEQERAEYEAEQKKEHIRYVAKNLPIMVQNVEEELGGFKNFKTYEAELQQVLKKVTDRWVGGNYGENTWKVVEAVVSTFYKSIPYQAAYDIYLAADWLRYEKPIVDEESPIPAKIQEKIHKRKFAELLNAKEEKAKLDKDIEPYLG